MASSHLQPLTTTSSDELSWNKQLMDCAAKGEISLFQDQLATLLKNTVPEEIFQPEGNKGSPLVRAAQNGQNMIVTYILKNFIEVLDLEYTMTVKSNHAVLEIRGVTALWCAALGGHIDIVRELVEAGANINHTNATNSTPLSAASYNNRVEVIKCLLNKGADISIANQGGLAPVMVAVMRDNEDAIRLLVTYGKADISQTTAAGIDLLHIAIERKSQKIFNLLIQLGAKIIWPCRGQTPSPPTPYYTVPDVYQPPSHIFVAAKCHNDYAIDYLSKQPKYLHEYEADVLLVRGIGRVFDDDAFQVTEVWKEALGFREKHNLDYPGKPALDLYEGVQEVKTLRDIDNLSEKRDLIHCVLISERIFGPLYYTSCEFKIQLINCLYSEGPVNHWRCCELLYQLLQALVKRNWKPPTQQSINQFNTLLYHVNKQLPAYDNTVITMEKFAAYFKCIYTSYASLLERIELNMNVSYQECLNQLLAFLNIWFQKFPSFTTLESVVHRNPLIVEALQLLFHPLTRDETIFHSIMKSENFLKNENVLNTFIAVSTPDMLEVSDKDGLTALHFACTLETVPDSLIPSLIEAGSHIDSVTSSKRTPIESCISELSPQYLALISFYPLKLVCLSARIIVQYQLSTDKLPGFFETFINLHRTPNSKGED